MSESIVNKTIGVPAAGPAIATAVAVEHDERADHLTEHLSNERTHVAYLRTAISLISVGIGVNRFSVYFRARDDLLLGHGNADLLRGTALAGGGMVVYGLVMMLLAVHRYRAVDDAIDHHSYHPDRMIVELLSITVIIAGAAAVLWMYRS